MAFATTSGETTYSPRNPIYERQKCKKPRVATTPMVGLVLEATPFENVFNAGTEESMPYGTRLSIATRANLVPTFGEEGALHIVQKFAYHMRIIPGSDFTRLQHFQNYLTWILQEKAPLEARRLIIRGNDALDLPLRSLLMRAADAMGEYGNLTDGECE
jgi:hypothetical protein